MHCNPSAEFKLLISDGKLGGKKIFINQSGKAGEPAGV